MIGDVAAECVADSWRLAAATLPSGVRVCELELVRGGATLAAFYLEQREADALREALREAHRPPRVNPNAAAPPAS